MQQWNLSFSLICSTGPHICFLLQSLQHSSDPVLQYSAGIGLPCAHTWGLRYSSHLQLAQPSLRLISSASVTWRDDVCMAPVLIFLNPCRHVYHPLGTECTSNFSSNFYDINIYNLCPDKSSKINCVQIIYCFLTYEKVR